MNEPLIKLEQERDFGDIFNATFSFFKQNFKPLMRIILYYIIPITLVMGIVTGLYQITVMEQIKNIKSSPIFLPHIGLPIILMYLFMFLTYSLLFGTIYEYMKLYKINNGLDFKYNQVGRELIKDARLILFTNFIYVLMIILGSIFMLIPGIYLAIALSILLPIRIIEGKSLSEAFSRCFYLIRSNWWITFSILFILSIIAMVLSQVFQMPLGIYTSINALHTISGGAPSPNQPLVIFLTIISSVGSIIIQCIPTISLGLQYFNLVEKKDGTQLLSQLDTLGADETSEPNQI